MERAIVSRSNLIQGSLSDGFKRAAPTFFQSRQTFEFSKTTVTERFPATVVVPSSVGE